MTPLLAILLAIYIGLVVDRVAAVIRIVREG